MWSGRNMRKRCGKTKNMDTRSHRQRPPAQTLTMASRTSDSNGGGGGRSRTFFGCYLLASLCPRYKGHSYIGFTVNPKRRIRQHNGEITSGASTTKKKRPWEMVLCIHGFPTHVTALQFEWAWQHPTKSLAVRQAAAAFKTRGGLANKIKLALTMLSLPAWHSMDLTVSFFSTNYMKHTAGCPSLPHHMKLHFCSMDELPCYCHSDLPHVQDEEDDIHSHCTQVFGDDRQLASPDSLLEMDCFSSHVQSSTENTTSQNKTWEHAGISTLESSSVVASATLEEPRQLLPHQVHPDIHGSAGNSSDDYEQLQVNNEIWSEGLRAPFPISDEHAAPFCRAEADPSKGLPYLMTEQHIEPFHQFPAGSGENNLNEQLQYSKEITNKGLRSWFSRQAESSSMDEHVTITEKFSKKDDWMLIDDRTKEKSQPTDTVQISSMEGIEVIDLLTPTTDCRIIGGSKKRRPACNSPDIIDLTRSPLFVQL